MIQFSATCFESDATSQTSIKRNVAMRELQSHIAV
jgi:hypothetical protein